MDPPCWNGPNSHPPPVDVRTRDREERVRNRVVDARLPWDFVAPPAAILAGTRTQNLRTYIRLVYDRHVTDEQGGRVASASFGPFHIYERLGTGGVGPRQAPRRPQGHAPG